jgi:hypothetical protein
MSALVPKLLEGLHKTPSQDSMLTRLRLTVNYLAELHLHGSLPMRSGRVAESYR